MYVIIFRERVHPPLAHGIQLHPTPQPPRLGRSVPHVLCIRKHVAKLSLAPGVCWLVTGSGPPHITPSVSFHSCHSVRYLESCFPRRSHSFRVFGLSFPRPEKSLKEKKK